MITVNKRKFSVTCSTRCAISRPLKEIFWESFTDDSSVPSAGRSFQRPGHRRSKQQQGSESSLRQRAGGPELLTAPRCREVAGGGAELLTTRSQDKGGASPLSSAHCCPICCWEQHTDHEAGLSQCETVPTLLSLSPPRNYQVKTSPSLLALPYLLPC